ncbi:discoidin, CUB and LCCL domain-containing protein 1 [Exaiptasia diaphana]|uniref:F5/8 type C domain-containing protein n=1 Tax=Exaiptasia diaphana TaxID=2652724 RepID=A0A913Y4N7_EXADI|nr:discoidin, CUB and LCCL domain-containing protein 1 [Exaiptasia diaphana]
MLSFSLKVNDKLKSKTASCSKHSVGVPSPFIIPSHRFTASSYLPSFKPSLARLEGGYSWLTRASSNEYLQIDLGQIFRICAVLTQGSPRYDHWVKNYTLQYSHDNKLWETYQEWDGKRKEKTTKFFQANSDRSTIVTNHIKYPFKAKFVRVVPGKTYSNMMSLRVDFKGTAEACTVPLGVENNGISDSQMTSSSSLDISHAASRGRLYGNSSWCSSSSSNISYIQVDLGRVKTVTGIATQGNPSRDIWVKSFILRYFRSGLWHSYKEGKATKEFTGNNNKHDVIVNWLCRPLTTRYIRIIPLTNMGGWKCMRLGLYGCDYSGNCYTPRINTLSTLFTTKLPTERTTEKGNCYTPRINTLSTLFTTKLPTERTTEKGMNIVVPAESSSTVPMVIAVIALGALVGFSLTTNVFLAYKLYKNKKGFQISSSPDGQPTHSLDNHVTNEGFIQEERATTNDEINQSTQETGEYMEPIDNNIATRPMTMPNTEANSTYMPLKPKEQAIYQPLLRNGNKMGNERKEGKKPTEYLEILPEEDLTAPYEDMSTNV